MTLPPNVFQNPTQSAQACQTPTVRTTFRRLTEPQKHACLPTNRGLARRPVKNESCVSLCVCVCGEERRQTSFRQKEKTYGCTLEVGCVCGRGQRRVGAQRDELHVPKLQSHLR